jgi:hypothetical protein
MLVSAVRRRWMSASPVSSWMQPTIRVQPSRRRKTRTRWQKPTRLSLTIVGKTHSPAAVTVGEFKEGEQKWQESIPLKRLATSVSWLTSMPVRRRPRSVSSSTRVSTTRSVKYMMVLQRWTGWFRSRSVVSRSRPLQRPATGKIIASTSLIRRVTWTSR